MRRLLLALGAAAVLALAAFAVATLRSGPPNTGDIPPSPVDGVVIRVESGGLNAVRSFTLRTQAGQQLVFDLSRLQNGAQFAPGHLAEHVATASPIRVDFAAGEAGVLFATRLEDVPSS